MPLAVDAPGHDRPGTVHAQITDDAERAA